MSLIIMAVHDTEENGRSEYTQLTLSSLRGTVDFSKHRLIISDNNSCLLSKRIMNHYYKQGIVNKILTRDENIGTARAINLGIRLREEGENCIKIDNDVVIHQSGWVEEMEEVIEREPSIGIVGLKRKDCWENPLRDDAWHSDIWMLPHEAGQRWIFVEAVQHVMGTCQMISSALLDTIGYFIQPSVYGFDDSLISFRSKLAGFKNVFIPHIDIDHVDVGTDLYSDWKRKHARENMDAYNKMCEEFKTGIRPLYYGGGFNNEN